MNDQQYRLIVNKGPEPGKVYELTSVSMTIGRDPLAEITINDPEVSRSHARLIGTLTGYRIQDLGSTNGTFVDSVRLGGEPLDLKIGQVITIGGGVVLVYQDMADDDVQSVTMLDTVMVPPMVQEQEDPPDIVGVEPDADETSPPPESEITIVESDGVSSESVSEELHHPPSVEPPSSETSWESIQQEEIPASNKDEPDSYEPEDFSEPVVISHQGEPDQPFSADKSNSTRRLSTIVAAVLILLICCCCSLMLFLYYYGGDWMLRQMGLLP